MPQIFDLGAQGPGYDIAFSLAAALAVTLFALALRRWSTRRTAGPLALAELVLIAVPWVGASTYLALTRVRAR